jgi:transposase
VVVDEEELRAKLAIVFPHLDERQQRILAGAEARAIGRSGIAVVARATGMSRATVHRAVAQVDQGVEISDRVRRPGGGRKRLTLKDRTLLADLEALVDPETRGDPSSPLRWTAKSTRQLADALAERGHAVSQHTVGELLHQLGYSLQANFKTQGGPPHPDRDAQFTYLNDQVKARLARGEPVVSVDTKKKELVGNYKNPGQEWERAGSPTEVSVYDFIDPAVPKAIPYGIYDVGQNAGWVSVGTDHDTAQFAVATLRRWWTSVGRRAYPGASRLLICADAGGSNGYRVRLWKKELARFATDSALEVTVCHFPPGTSKWNKIEHRLFSYISMNWRGRPLTSHRVVVDLIGSTTNRKGLTVRAELDDGTYPPNIKVTDEELATLPITRHDFHGEWNYTLAPSLR